MNADGRRWTQMDCCYLRSSAFICGSNIFLSRIPSAGSRARCAGGRGGDELIEAALALVLIEELQPVLVELVKELLPLHRRELVGAGTAGEVDAEQAGLAALGPLDTRRLAAARFG